MKKEVWSSLFFFAAMIFLAPIAHADLESTALKASKNISKAVQYTAEQIDLTLSGGRYTDHANDSRLSVSQIVTSTEGGIIRTSTDMGVNLRLPNVEKHWQLRFSTYDEEQEERDMNQRRVRTVPRTREYGASLFFLRKLGDVRVAFQPKVQLKDPLEISYVLRFDSSAETKYFRLAPKLEFFADATKGTGEYFGLSFIFRLRKNLELTFENEEEYRQMKNFFTTRHGLTLDYSHDQKNKFGTAFVATSENHEFHLSNLTYSVSYGRELYRNLLSFVISPFIGFNKGDNFKGKVGITSALTATF